MFLSRQAVYYGFYKPSRTFKCCPEDPGLNPGSEIFFSDEKGLTNSGLRDGMATSLVLDFFYLYRGARLCNLQWLTLFLCFYLMPERIKNIWWGLKLGEQASQVNAPFLLHGPSVLYSHVRESLKTTQAHCFVALVSCRWVQLTILSLCRLSSKQHRINWESKKIEPGAAGRAARIPPCSLAQAFMSVP